MASGVFSVNLHLITNSHSNDAAELLPATDRMRTCTWTGALG